MQSATAISIYSGGPDYLGVSYDNVQGIKNVLLKHIPSSTVLEMNAEEMFNFCRKKEGQKKIIVLPGGVCSLWDRYFDPEKHSAIKEFIEGGSTALLICAGAYYASKKSSFTSGSTKIKKERTLKLYKGKAKGPLYPESNRSSITNSRVVDIIWESTKEKGCVFLNGGGYFKEPAKNDASIEVMARYTSGEVAILSQKIKEGLAILSFVHLEYETLPDEWQELNKEAAKAFDDSTPFREKCLSEIVSVL